jgi:2-polyprenyl-6-methoxyphenol hydroxylase-like FAD-dependent oxidoreductase
MKTLIVGAGPAGLYLAFLMKRQDPDAEIRVIEQNPADATFGFGVVFSDRALQFLRDDDAETYEALMPAVETWTDLTLNHRGKAITIDGVGFAATGRLQLLQILQKRLATVGITPEYRHVLSESAELEGYDLVVGADGANSFVRKGRESDFGTSIEPLKNKFVWYGTTKRFETLSQTFINTDDGTFNAHHYRYSPSMSTFIVECDPATWQRVGFATKTDQQSREYCERAFSEVLGGHALIENKSVWRNFPRIWNERWFAGNRVLVGDAARTAHFSIGSGTRLALEDAIFLARSLRDHSNNVPMALVAYETARKPIAQKLTVAANLSAEWYEHFPEHMKEVPWALAWSYIQRSGRVDLAKLKATSPRFVDGFESQKVAI